MDSELLDALNDVICSYRDADKVAELIDFWRSIEPIVEDDALKSFILGSIYGQCIFLYNSYHNYSASNVKRKDFEELLSKIIKGMGYNFKQVNSINL